MKKLLPLMTLAAICAASQIAHGQSAIVFSPAQNASGDANFNLAGTFVSAFAFDQGTSETLSTGLVFAATGTSSINANTPTTFGTGTGSITLNINSDSFHNYEHGGSVTGASAAYDSLLAHEFYINNGAIATLTFNGLTTGAAYQFEFLGSDPSNSSRETQLTDPTVPASADFVQLAGAGQYTIGSFVATGATETIDISSPTGSTANLNAVELSQTAAAPEPSTWAMLIGGFGLLLGAQRLSRQRNV